MKSHRHLCSIANKTLFSRPDSTNKFQTPNNLYNKLIEQKVFTPTIIKNAGNKTSQDYEDAVIDDGVKAAIKN